MILVLSYIDKHISSNAKLRLRLIKSEHLPQEPWFLFVTIIYIYILILYYTIWNYLWWNHKIPRLMTAFVPRDPSGSARRILLSASSFKTIRCCASEAVHPRSVNPSWLEYFLIQIWCNCEMFKCRFWFIYSRVAEYVGWKGIRLQTATAQRPGECIPFSRPMCCGIEFFHARNSVCIISRIMRHNMYLIYIYVCKTKITKKQYSNNNQ